MGLGKCITPVLMQRPTPGNSHSMFDDPVVGYESFSPPLSLSLSSSLSLSPTVPPPPPSFPLSPSFFLSSFIPLSLSLCWFRCVWWWCWCRCVSVSLSRSLLDGYCSTVQGLLDWFEVDLASPSFCLFRLISVFCVFLFSTPSHSPLVLFRTPALLPPCGRMPVESALYLVGRMSPCGSDSTYIAVLGVKITCSICQDRAHDSSIYRGIHRRTHQILESR